MRPERIGVVVSTYNRPEMLKLVLQGFQRQTDDSFSLYIADDGSDERTANIIQDAENFLPVPVVHVWHEDKGFRKARIHNLTLLRTQEPYLLFIDGDCIPPPNLVAVHRRFARKGCLISGRRVLLSEKLTEQICSRGALPRFSLAQCFLWRLTGNLNRIFPFCLPPMLGPATKKLAGIRGCHLSCWRSDLMRINGFDEAFEGWGREDSDLVARLLHAGLARRNLLSPPVFHLWHAHEDRTRLAINDRMLQACLDEKRVVARKGVRQLESSA